MRILEVMQSLPPATGTTEFFVESIRAMMRRGAEVDVLCGDTCGNDLGAACVFSNLKDYTSAVQPLTSNLRPDIVHIHGLWSPFLAKAHWWAHKRGVPVVVSTHGMLSPWSFKSKWYKKCAYWHLIEKPNLKRVAAFHVTADHEGQWVRDVGFNQPQFKAPLGVGVPDVFEGEKIVDGKRLVISVGRIYRVKGLDRIVRAVKLLKDAGKWNGWQLVLAGPNWMDYQPELEGIIAECGLQDDVKLPGPVFGADKDKFFRNASIYIVASYTENFCQPVAEALTYGVPAVASKGCPWQGLETHQCGVWTENEPASLARSLEMLMSKSDAERKEMGLRGRQWMIDEFSWVSVGESLIKGFDAVCKK